MGIEALLLPTQLRLFASYLSGDYPDTTAIRRFTGRDSIGLALPKGPGSLLKGQARSRNGIRGDRDRAWSF